MRTKYSAVLDGFDHVVHVFTRRRKALRFARNNAMHSYAVRSHPINADLCFGVGFGQLVEFHEDDPEMQAWLDP